MRILITGDRNWTHEDVMTKALHEHVCPGDIVIEGDARGADRMARKIAAGMVGVVVESYPADWNTYHRAAGPIRNQKMLNTGIDLVLAFHDDLASSKGTKDMVTRALKRGIPVRLYSRDSSRDLSEGLW